MIFIYLASLFTLFILISQVIKKPHKGIKEKEQAFWEKEALANSTRKKSLDTLPFIQLPLPSLFLTLLPDNETAKSLQQTLTSLAKKEIVNFTGISNTDLKLEYGTANITLLSKYDQQYTLLARTLQSYALLLFEEGYVDEAKTILEFAISTNTDISATYKLLTSIYLLENSPEKIAILLEQAESISSLSKDFIVRTLKESYQYND